MIDQLASPATTSHRMAFVALFILAIGLRLACFEGYADANPRAYAMLASDLSQGELHIPDPEITPVFPVRIGAYAPAAVLIGFFGLSDVTMVGFVLLVDIASLLLIYIACRIAFGGLAGLIGLMLLTLSPLDVTMSTRFLPHLVAAFWGNLGMCLTWAALTMHSRARSRLLLGLLAGLSFGCSWMTYESVAYLVPPVVIILFLARQRTARERLWITAMIGIGSVSVLCAEMTLHWWRTGDLLYRLHATERNYEACSEFFFVQSSTRFGWNDGEFSKVIIDRLLIDGPMQMLLGRSIGGITVLGLAACAWAAVTRRRNLLLPGLWLVWLLLMFNFMTTSFESYKPLPIIPYLTRYLMPLLFPSAVLGAALISNLMRPTGLPETDSRRFPRPAVGLLLLALACIAAIPGLTKGITNEQFPTERRAISLAGEDGILFTDMRSAGNIIYLRDQVLAERTDTTIPFEDVDPSDLPAGSVLLINDSMKQLLVEGFQYSPPAYFDEPRPEWTLLWEKPRVRIYRVAP